MGDLQTTQLVSAQAEDKHCFCTSSRIIHAYASKKGVFVWYIYMEHEMLRPARAVWAC